MSQVAFLDDEPDFLSSLMEVAPSYGFVPFVSGSLDDLIRFVGENPEGMVVSDLRMPSVNGADALRELREVAPRALLYVLSSYRPTEAESEILRAVRAPLFDKRKEMFELLEELGKRVTVTDQTELTSSVSSEKYLSLLQKYESSASLNRELASDLLDDLRAIPAQHGKLFIGEESFSVEELIEDIINQTDRGMYHVQLWREVVSEMRRLWGTKT